MADKWIVSNYHFHQHKSREAAEAELQRLSEKLPKKRFRIYRLKTALEPSGSRQRIEELEAENARLRAMVGEDAAGEAA